MPDRPEFQIYPESPQTKGKIEKNGEERLKQKRTALMLAMLLMISALGGCSGQKALNKYQVTLLDYFDTVTSITGYAEDENAFTQMTSEIREELEAYDRLYDIYHEYPGMVNLCTINSHPGETWTVDQRVIDLLLFAREADEFSGHRTSAMLGSLLRIWHEAREEATQNPDRARLPSEESLREAKAHTGFDLLEIDPENRTVRITDPEARLDVGALAKGYAVQRIAEKLPEGVLISAGGNVAATGPKPDGSDWIIGIQNPDGEGYLRKVALKKGAVVTSGDYQRYYLVDGKAYHHIIDPETLFPSEKWRAVTVVCMDSGTADALSTSLFLMEREEGQKLLERFQAEAMWIGKDGTEYFSPGFRKLIKD